MLTNAAASVALVPLFAVALMPATMVYYLWLARHVAPRLVSQPIRLAITILALWVALPWVLLTVAVWLTRP